MFYITISNGLLTKEHKTRMGSAVWEFMWCLDKITKVDTKGKGIVLGGKPVKLKDIGMGHDNTVSRNLQKLQEEKYIEMTHTPYGIVIRVLKAKKRFTKNSDSTRMVATTNGEPLTDNGEPLTDNGEPLTDNGEPNKTVSVDIAVDSIATVVADPLVTKKNDQDPLTCDMFVASCRKSPSKHIQVIGEWAEAEQPKHSTRGEWKAFLTRNLRAAKNLAPYEIPKIEKAYNLMRKDLIKTDDRGKKVGFLTRYTLETVSKYIDLV